MDHIDMQRIQAIVARVLQQQGEAAFAGWRPTPLDTLQAELYNTLHADYPELDVHIHVRAAISIGGGEGSPRDVTVFVERVEEVGKFTVRV